MASPDYDALIEGLDERVGDSLRWVASFDSDRYAYTVRYIRKDLETELSDRELDTIVHRSMAVFNRDHVEDVYFHLGAARSLVVEYEGSTAIHLYLEGGRGVTVKVESGTPVTLPEFREACLEFLQ
jgi:hypothetical protein